jgi:hypothetical protein
MHVYFGFPHLNGEGIGLPGTPFLFVINEKAKALVKRNEPFCVGGRHSDMVNTSNRHLQPPMGSV